MAVYVGLDWASAQHAVCRIDASGAVLDRFQATHSAEGLEQLMQRLRKDTRGEPVRIAVERPSGLLIDTLVEAGFEVVPIHPNVVKSSRSRYRTSQAKDDRSDAYLLADLLRTDGHRFRPLLPLSDEIKALRSAVRGRDDLVAQRVALANQLRALLESFWAGAAAIFADIDSPIALAFLERYPTPRSTERLGEKRLVAFLAQHGYCGRRPVGELLKRLRSAPLGHAGHEEQLAKGNLVRALVACLRPLIEQIACLSRLIAHQLAQIPRGQVLMSFPRAGRICAAQILSEMGDQPARLLSADHLAAEAGVAPVTYQSGKHLGVGFRWACNKRLRRALCTLADNSRHCSDWAARLYLRARQRGCDHPHATRILAKAWCGVIYRAWTDLLPYDATRHRAASRSLAAGNPAGA